MICRVNILFFIYSTLKNISNQFLFQPQFVPIVFIVKQFQPEFSYLVLKKREGSADYFCQILDFALHDHVLATFSVTWEWGCAEKCQQDSWCRSFNYQSRSTKGSHVNLCEINSATRGTRMEHYYYRAGFTYHEPEVVVNYKGKLGKVGPEVYGFNPRPGRGFNFGNLLPPHRP